MARLFDGSNDRGDINVNPDLTNAFTMWGWTRTTTVAAGNGQVIASDESSDGDRNFQFRRNAASLQFIIFVGNSATTLAQASVFIADTWTFVAAVKRAGNLFLYDGDGQTLNENDKGALGTPDNDPADITIGARRKENVGNPTEFFSGRLACLGLINDVALTFNELRTVMARGLSFRSPLFQCLLAGQGDPEPDFSGNGNNCDLINGPTIADHAPVGPPFGFDMGWMGNVVAVVAVADELIQSRRVVIQP